MTSENESGAGKLAQRILDDAGRDACAAAEEAARTVEKLRNDSDATVAAKRAEFEKNRAIAAAGVIDGCRTRASIEGRKAALKRKRDIIDRVYAQAYDALIHLDDGQRSVVCRRILLAETVGGETVVPAKADRQTVQACISEGLVKDLKLADQDAPFDGGFRLVGDGYEKDCSFSAVLRELRDTEETAVADLLFH